MTLLEKFKEIRSKALTSYEEKGEENIVIKEGVTYISSRSFSFIKAKTITLPDSVIGLQKGSFYRCKNLETIVIGKGLKEYFPNPFVGCPKLKNICVDNRYFSSFGGIVCDSHNRILFCPPGITGDVILKEGITEIATAWGNRPFYLANKITSLTFPLSYKKLCKVDLVGLKSLVSITLPKTLIDIEDKVFTDLLNIKKINIDKENPVFESDETGVYNKQKGIIYRINKELKGSYTLKPYIKSIKNSSFDGCSFDTIIIPKDIVLSDLITHYAGVFYNCKNLKRLIIENKNTIIKSSMFLSPFQNYTPSFDSDEWNFYKSFATTFYPSQLSKDDKFILSLKVIEILQSKKEVSNEWKNEWIKYFTNNAKNFLSLIKTNSSVREFYLSQKLLNLKNTQEIIHSLEEEKSENADIISAFLDYENSAFSFDEREKQREQEIKEMDPFSMSYIKKRFIFTYLKDGGVRIDGYKGNEEDIVVPEIIGKEKVCEIGPYAFSSEQKNLTDEKKNVRKTIKKIVLPHNLEKIYESAFEGCLRLEEINIPANCKFPFSGGKIDFCHNTIRDCISLKKIEIEEGCESLPLDMFYFCNSIEEIYLPSTIIDFSALHFNYCENLKEVHFREGIKALGIIFFFNCNNLTTLTFPKSLLKFNLQTDLLSTENGKYITLIFLNKDTKIILMNPCYNKTFIIKSEKGGLVEKTCHRYSFLHFREL